MAVTKRTRYEVLRRDNFTCRYCRSADNPLTVDHVTPTALGGGDDPSNLVAACKDCNAGKSSTSPDAETVADVSEDAVRWAKAIEAVGRARKRAKVKRDNYVKKFAAAWDAWHHGRYMEPIPRASDWRTTLWQFYELGLPIHEVEDAVTIACSNGRISADATWRYFCGVCWRKLDDIHTGAREHIGADADVS